MPNGKLINEDALSTFFVESNGQRYDFVILMDGATGLGESYQIVEGCTSAEWYVSFVMKKLQEIFKEEPLIDLNVVVEKCIKEVIDQITIYEKNNNVLLEEYQKPSAALLILRNNGKTTDIFVVGDIQVILAKKDGNVTKVNNPNENALKKLDNTVINKMVELSTKRCCNIINILPDQEIQDMLKINRTKKNTDCEDGYWVCGTTLGLTNHAVLMNYDNVDLSGLVLASDGFDFGMLNVDESQVYELILENGLEKVVRDIRHKQEEDCLCNNFPRFKKSDDLTVVYCDYSDF